MVASDGRRGTYNDPTTRIFRCNNYANLPSPSRPPFIIFQSRLGNRQPYHTANACRAVKNICTRLISPTSVLCRCNRLYHSHFAIIDFNNQESVCYARMLQLRASCTVPCRVILDEVQVVRSGDIFLTKGLFQTLNGLMVYGGNKLIDF